MSLTALNRDQFHARAADLQVRAVVDRNLRLVAAQVVITEPLSKKLLTEDCGTVELPHYFFLVVAPAVEAGAWIQRVKIRVATDMVPVRMGDEDSGQRRQPGGVGAKGFVRAFGEVRPCACINSDEFTPVF